MAWLLHICLNVWVNYFLKIFHLHIIGVEEELQLLEKAVYDPHPGSNSGTEPIVPA